MLPPRALRAHQKRRDRGGDKSQKCPQYCWEFHDRLWEALSGTTSEKRSAPSRTGGGDNSGNALDASNALNYRVWGIPAVLSTGIPGNALRAFPGSFRSLSGISSGKCQPYWGYGPKRSGGESYARKNLLSDTKLLLTKNDSEIVIFAKITKFTRNSWSLTQNYYLRKIILK